MYADTHIEKCLGKSRAIATAETRAGFLPPRVIFLTDDGQAESDNMFDEAGVSWIGASCHESINARYPLAYYSCVVLGLALDIAST